MSAPSNPDVALRATDLVKTYRTGHGRPPVRALDGLNLAVAPAQVLALLGRNGAGKSTTVKILTALARADSGSATVLGLDVARRPDAVRRVIGLVTQRSSSDPMATGRENVELAGRIQGLPRIEARRRAGELLERFDLADAADRLAKTWSGGMARRLDLAIGLVHRPSVLFLDEPTTGLDPEARSALWSEIAGLVADESVTVVLTTHYLEEADELADTVAIVDGGRVVVEGSPNALKAELHGDTVQIELAAACAGAADAVAATTGLSDVRSDGVHLRARAVHGARAVPAVLAALDAVAADVDSVTVARPSLDDVYLRHVGRAMATEVAA